MYKPRMLALVFWLCFWVPVDSQRWLPLLFNSFVAAGVVIFELMLILLLLFELGDKGGLAGVLAKFKFAFDL